MTVVVALTAREQERLRRAEEKIEQGFETFKEVGNELWFIRAANLYRETHSTFSLYLRERWGISDSRGRQLIAAAATVTNVTELGAPAPSTESQARELSGLPAETAAEVMCKAHDDTDGKVTASAIREAREAIAPKPKTEPKPEPNSVSQTFVCDCGASFDHEVWHCPADAHHWLLSEPVCRNCYAYQLDPDNSVGPVRNNDGSPADPWPPTVNTLDLDDDGRPADPLADKIAAELDSADWDCPGQLDLTEGETQPAHPSRQPRIPEPVLAGDRLDRYDGEKRSKDLGWTCTTLWSLIHPMPRRQYIDAWRDYPEGASPAQREHVGPNQFRAYAAALLTLADEWDITND